MMRESIFLNLLLILTGIFFHPRFGFTNWEHNGSLMIRTIVRKEHCISGSGRVSIALACAHDGTRLYQNKSFMTRPKKSLQVNR